MGKSNNNADDETVAVWQSWNRHLATDNTSQSMSQFFLVVLEENL